MINGSFDLPYEVHPYHSNIFTAHGWHPWWSDKKWPDQDQNSARPLKTPEYKAITLLDDANRVLDGDAAQCFFVFSALMNAGVFQQVEVGAGRRCTFALPFHTWCSQSDNPRISDAELYVRVGIDTRGGVDYEAESIVWGNWVRGTNEYASTSISAISETETVTLWVHAWNKWAVKHSDVYLDAATFEVAGEEPSPPPTDVQRVEVTGPDGGPIVVRIETPTLGEMLRGLLRR